MITWKWYVYTSRILGSYNQFKTFIILSRPSITRISGDAKDHKKELWNSQDSLKSVSLPETIQEKTIPESPTIIHPKNEKGKKTNDF